jgi:hypothetical protein
MLVRVYQYRSGSPWNHTDQIGVGVSMWERIYSGHSGERPVFVSLNGGFVAGRVRPDPGLNWEPGRVEIPDWMWIALGAPDMGAIMELETVELMNVGRLVLRPRDSVVEDPVSLLTVALSNGSWATLSAGMELALDCGIFDVVRMENLVGEEIVAGCILDQDVTLDLDLPAVSAPVPVAPVPVAPVLDTSGGGGVMTFPGMVQSSTARRGYIPFGGTGNRLT